MKITLAGLLFFSTMIAQAQVEIVEVVAAVAAPTETAAVMTPADATAPKAEFEITCRAQAKEVAANAYRSCVTDGRSAQIEQLKKDYQDQIAALKARYEAEIKFLSSANAAAAAEKAALAPAAAPAPAKSVKAAPSATAAKAKKKTSAPIAGAKKSLSPGKAKVKQAKALASAAVPVAAKPVNVEEVKEMNIELKPAAKTFGATDDSTMDLPEPIAVENN